MNDSKPVISVVTFLRDSESVNESFTDLISELQQCQNLIVESRLYTENTVPDIHGAKKDIFTEIIVQPRQTKFRRILDMLKNTDSDYVLCIDSDIKIEIEKIRNFLSQSITNKYDLAWGRILCFPTDSVIKRSVQVDKVISHYIIRPLLWKLNIGVSVPGQIMLIRRDAFLDELCCDTFLDDIALGIYARQHNLNTFYSSEVLGYEEPCETVLELFNQRRRWADGFSKILQHYYKSAIIIYLLIHIILYHFLVPALTFTVIALSLLFPIPICTFLLSCALLTSLLFGYQYALQPIFYSGLFTCLHIEWWRCVCYNLLFRNQSNGENNDHLS